MNYKKIYDELITKAKLENRKKFDNVYYESHHIIPTSLGGKNTSENKVFLTGREHFIAHWLLYKMHKGAEKSKMAHAWFSMSRKSYNQDRLKITSRKYEFMKKAHAKAASEFHKGKKLTNKQIIARKYNNPNAKKVIFDNICFLSIKDAAIYFNTNPRVIRACLNNKLPYKYLIDIEFRKKWKSDKIRKKLKNKNKGKTYLDLYGEEKSKEIKAKQKLAKMGKNCSLATREKISAANRGNISWNKGKQFSEESRKKMSESRKGDSRSPRSYKIINPYGDEYVVENKGLRWFWNNVLNEKFPTTFKSVVDFKEGKNGKWKGWKVYVLSKGK